MIDRFVDAARFASLADPALGSGETVTLTEELRRYHQLYEIPPRWLTATACRDQRRRKRSSPRPRSGTSRQASPANGSVGRARSGRGGPPPLVVAVPVTSSDQVVGGSSRCHRPTGPIGHGPVVGAGRGRRIVAGAAFAAAAVALTRWILRPVRELDAAAHRSAPGPPEAPLPAASGHRSFAGSPCRSTRWRRTWPTCWAGNVEFVSLASHQMRNPLTALSCGSRRWANSSPTRSARDEHRWPGGNARLGHILDDLLALARAEGGRYERRVVDAAVTADERVAAWLPLADQRGIAYPRRPAPPACWPCPPRRPGPRRVDRQRVEVRRTGAPSGSTSGDR